MSNERKIPDAETRERSVNNLRELVKRMDRHIADLDALNAQLEAENQKSPFAAYFRRKEQRLAVSDKECSSSQIGNW